MTRRPDRPPYDDGVADHANFPSRRRLSLTDVSLAVCLAAIALVVAAEAGHDTPGATSPERWWEWVLVALPSVTVAFRRAAPMWAAPIAVVAQMLVWFFDLAEVFVAPLVMIYSVAALGTQHGLRMAIACSVALSAMAGIGTVAAPDVGNGVFALTVLSSAVVLMLGVNAARQRQESATLAAQLTVAELEQEAAEGYAVAQERERIASELHDLLGHSLSVIAVRAEAASRVSDTNPAAGSDALDAIGDTARSSLGEVRRVLRGIHGEDLELSPLPDLRDVDALVARVAATGVEVELYRTDAVASTAIDASVGAGAYRIIQEALTNVMKHAGPTARATVDIDINAGSAAEMSSESTDDERRGAPSLTISVIDDGYGARPNGTAERGVGLGIVGMSERAAFLGGNLEAGPQPGGGFRVRATIPVERP